MDDMVTCTMCGKVHKRADTGDWVYYKGDLYCTAHPGVMLWYRGALRLEEERYKIETEKGG
jgi:hypothetical protein